MASKYWIKLYHEILDDAKVGRLPVNLKWRFVELLLLAGEEDDGGWLPDSDAMAWRLRVDEDQLERDLSQLAAVGIVEYRARDAEQDAWFVVHFADRQSPSPAAERMREYRKRQRRVSPPTPPSSKKDPETEEDADTYRAVTVVTKSNGNVTAREENIIAIDADGLGHDPKKVQMVRAFCGKWLKSIGRGMPADQAKAYELYLTPAAMLLDRYEWDMDQAMQVAQAVRAQMLTNGKTPYYLSAIVPRVFAAMDAIHLEERWNTT